MEPAPEVAGLGDLVEIGRGGFGVVYRAMERDLERPVAVKILFGELDEQARRRFDRERRAMGKVSGHPHVVTVYRTGLTGSGHPFIVMELLERGSMRDRLKRDGPLAWAEAVDAGLDIASALEVAHAAGVLHRDVKPGNLLVSSHGMIKLADFGIAFVSGTTETKSGVVTASLVHAAPEVIAGRRPDERSDIYSLGSTLHELMRGSAPFTRDDEDSLIPMLARIARDPPPSLAGAGVPHAVCDVMDRAMAKDPADRPQTAAQLREQLARAKAARPIQAAHRTTLLGPGALAPPPDVAPATSGDSVGPDRPNGHTPAGPDRPFGHAPPDRDGPPPGMPSADLLPQTAARRARGSKLALGVGGLLAALGFVAVVVIAVVIVLALNRLNTGDPSERPSDPGGLINVDSTASPRDDDVSTLLDSAFSDTTASGSGDAGAVDYDEYVTVDDQDEIVSVDVPAAWSDVTATRGTVLATERRSGFINSYEASGVGINVSRTPGADLDQLLDGAVETECDSVERIDYDDGRYVGRADVWTGCDDNILASVMHVMANPVDDSDVLVVMSVQLTQVRDFLAAQRVLDSLVVDSGAV